MKRVAFEDSKDVAIHSQKASGHYYEIDADERTPDGQRKMGLFAAIREPVRIRDIKTFQSLHSPRIHRMTEWILQYERTCRRQQQYLQQMKELHQQFNNSHIIKNHLQSNGKSNYFWKPSQPLPGIPAERLSNKTCVLHQPKKNKLNLYGDYMQICETSKVNDSNCFLVAPRPPDTSSFYNNHARVAAILPPLGELDRNKTDYEPIEEIARRNKLNLSKYLREERPRLVTKREAVAMSEVSVEPAKIA